MPDRRGRGPDPRDGWLAAVLPSGARRLLVHDERLSGALAPLVLAGVPDAEIGPAPSLTGAAACVAVPVHAPESPSPHRAVRAARRVAGAASVRHRTAGARRRLRRLGYPEPSVLVWERGTPLRDPRAVNGGPRAHRLPLNAVVTARREPAATLLDAIAEAASADAVGPRIGSSGVLVAETDRGYLRVAVGPARGALAAHATALAELRRAWPAAAVAGRVPWTLAAGETGLAAWALELRLDGATPAPAIGPRLAAECLDFLVALHDVRGDAPATASCSADAQVVAAECRPEQAARIRALGEDLDQRLVGLPRGFAHGDFWSGNLLVSGDSLTGVVDWAAAGSSRLPLLDLLHLHVSARRELTGASLGAALLDYAGGATGAERAAAAAYERRTGVDADRGDLLAAYWLSATARELTDPDRSRDRRAAARFVRDNVDRVAERLAVPVRRSR